MATAQNALFLFARALTLLLQGRVSFRRDFGPDELRIEGELFLPFRTVAVSPPSGRYARPQATFRVRFRFKNLSPGANRALSLIPIPMILAQPGFRSKTWHLGQSTGDFVGHYEFDTIEEAQAYWDSLPLRMMRRRAAPGSVTYEVRRATQQQAR